MNAIIPKGWCPSVFEPMAAADGWLVRVKPPAATLTAAAARRLAAAAGQFGNGSIELTSRANLQVRGLTPDGVAPFAAAMAAAGLADPDPATERRRAVIHPPLSGAGLSMAIEAMLATDPGLARLPAKFAVAVDVAAPADLTVLSGVTGFLVAPAGASWAAEAADPVEAVRRLALAFLELAARTTPPPRRMRGLDTGRVFAAAGLNAVVSMIWPSPPRFIGRLSSGVFGLGVPFGVMTTATLASLADLAERFGDATVRITPWRAVLLPGVTALELPDCGLVADPSDPRLDIVTCTGRPGCSHGSVDVRADAAQLLALKLPGKVHVSGCAKGCAHHAAAPVTLVGGAGRYAVVRNGRAGDPPEIRGLTMRQVVDELAASR
jgi:precorrin-3B synthase